MVSYSVRNGGAAILYFIVAGCFRVSPHRYYVQQGQFFSAIRRNGIKMGICRLFLCHFV